MPQEFSYRPLWISGSLQPTSVTPWALDFVAQTSKENLYHGKENLDFSRIISILLLALCNWRLFCPWHMHFVSVVVYMWTMFFDYGCFIGSDSRFGACSQLPGLSLFGFSSGFTLLVMVTLYLFGFTALGLSIVPSRSFYDFFIISEFTWSCFRLTPRGFMSSILEVSWFYPLGYHHGLEWISIGNLCLSTYLLGVVSSCSRDLLGFRLRLICKFRWFSPLGDHLRCTPMNLSAPLVLLHGNIVA